MEAGANALGLVSAMPSGPGVIDDELIRTIALKVSPGIDSFLLTSKTRAQDIIDQAKLARTSTIQLVDKVDLSVYPILKEALEKTNIVQVVHVLDQNSIEEAIEIAPFVDAILLDSGNPNKKIKELGGTGRTHNWGLSRQICETISKPVYLAGGLNHENVVEAIQMVRPYGVDLCSGVRTGGHLDPNKLQKFISTVRVSETV